MEETKRCPYCGEEILAIAKKCKYCGEWLEPHGVMIEKKQCPICGESIDANLDVCPFCNEPTHFHECYAEEEQQCVSLKEGEYLYCKTCKEKISANATACPNCGDADPFFFLDIKKTRKKTNLGCGKTIGIAVLMTLLYRFLGSPNGLLTWNSTEENLFFIVFIAIFIIGIVYSRYHTKNHREEMDKIFQQKNDPLAHDIWEKKLEEVCE